MIKETTILSGAEHPEVTYASVDAFFRELGFADWRAAELKLFTDAGFDVTDSTKQMVALSEDGTKVIITVAYADQAEKDAILAEASANSSTDAPAGLMHELSENHLF